MAVKGSIFSDWLFVHTPRKNPTAAAAGMVTSHEGRLKWRRRFKDGHAVAGFLHRAVGEPYE